MRHTVEQGTCDNGRSEACEAGAETCSAMFCSVAQPEKAGDARGEWAAVCGEAQRRSSPPFFHSGERARVVEMITASGDGDVVAAVFALGAHALVQPPNRRMEKEKRFRSDLEKIDERVEAANVREFMGDDGFDLVFGESGERANWKQNHWAKIA